MMLIVWTDFSKSIEAFTHHFLKYSGDEVRYVKLLHPAAQPHQGSSVMFHLEDIVERGVNEKLKQLQITLLNDFPDLNIETFTVKPPIHTHCTLIKAIFSKIFVVIPAKAFKLIPQLSEEEILHAKGIHFFIIPENYTIPTNPYLPLLHKNEQYEMPLSIETQEWEEVLLNGSTHKYKRKEGDFAFQRALQSLQTAPLWISD